MISFASAMNAIVKFTDMKNKYFKHDIGARNDSKLVRLVRVKGVAAKGIYWDLIEMLYEEGGILPLETIEDVSYSNHLRSNSVARYVVYESGLFEYDDTHFWSDRQKRDMNKMIEIQEVRSSAGKKGGEAKAKQNSGKILANATQSDKEEIIKLKETNKELANAVERLYNLYPASVLRADGNKVSLRSGKDKEKIKRLLATHSEEELTKTIKQYLSENHGAYTKMFATFLNNLPDYGGDSLPFNAPQEQTKKVQRFANAEEMAKAQGWR